MKSLVVLAACAAILVGCSSTQPAATAGSTQPAATALPVVEIAVPTPTPVPPAVPTPEPTAEPTPEPTLSDGEPYAVYLAHSTEFDKASMTDLLDVNNAIAAWDLESVRAAGLRLQTSGMAFFSWLLAHRAQPCYTEAWAASENLATQQAEAGTRIGIYLVLGDTSGFASLRANLRSADVIRERLQTLRAGIQCGQ